MQLELVTTTPELERLEPEWTSLWQRAPAATPFQSPAWLVPWWRNLGEGELWTLAFLESGRLVALAPFYIYHDPAGGERQLLLLGCGTSDSLDILVDGDRKAHVGGAIFAEIAGA